MKRDIAATAPRPEPGSEPTEVCTEHFELPEAEPFIIEGLGNRIGRALKKIFRF